MAEEASPISFEDLSLIEAEFDDIDNQILRTQYELSRGAYAKRTATIAQIPKFWPLVFEQAPGEIDRYITPNDSRIFGDSLLALEVLRPELEPPASSADPSTPFTPAPTASPRSLTIRFTFADNPDFADRVLEKHFWYRRAADGWTGLVSEPVRIAWKAGQDPTEGLTDGARALWEARAKRGDWRATDLPEYAALKEKVEHWNGLNTSFFTWFGWVSGRRWVSAEESEGANRVEREKKEARAKKGGKAAGEEEEEEEDDEEQDDEEVEVFEDGEDLAVSLADDLWPNAIKFFVAAQESEEIFSELDFEEMDDEDDEDDDEDAEPVDMRELLKENGHGRKASGSGGPPSKKQKK